MEPSTVLILGGGVGGLVAANELRRRLSRDTRVVVVDRENRHTFWPSLVWLQVGLREPGSITRDLSALRKKGIEVVRGEVSRIDPENRSVVVDDHVMSGDFLVVALGAQLMPDTIPGLPGAGYNLYSVEGATAIRDARTSLTSGRLVVLVTRTPFKCPAAPYEAAMLLEHDLRKRKVRNQVVVSMYTPEPGPMPVAGTEASTGIRRLIEERGIDYRPQSTIAEVDGVKRTLQFTNGAAVPFDFLVYIPPHGAPWPVREAGLTGETGWVPVDRHTMETRFPGVFAIGDVTGVPLDGGMALPKAGVFAHRQAEAVAATIAARITGKGEPGSFDGHGECFVEVGGGKAGFGRGDFYAQPRAIKFHQPTRYWHAGKVFFEKDWFRRWF